MSLTDVSRRLRQNGSQTPALDGRLLIQLAGDLTEAQVLTGDYQLTPGQQRRLDQLIAARRQLPLAYLTGHREFYGHQFAVDPRVLIPRPTSEDLIDLALGLGPHPAVYDVGCGSGCLGLAYQLSCPVPTRYLYLVDASAAALAVARRNAQTLGCPASFWHRPVADLNPTVWQTDSLVLANLPYLDNRRRTETYRRCPDLTAEPPIALFSGRGGLQIYRQLWSRLGTRPRHLVLEADWPQHPILIAWARRFGWRLVGHRGLGLAFARSGSNDPALPVTEQQDEADQGDCEAQ